MKLVVWQNMLSPHQAPLLNALAVREDIKELILVVEQDLSPERAQMGWEIPTYHNIELVIAPSSDELDERKRDFDGATHLVSGFAQGKYGDWIRHNLKRFFLYTELAKSDSKWRSFINQIRYRHFYSRIEDQVQGIFAIGAQCPHWLKSVVSVPQNKIIPFGYFLHSDHSDSQAQSVKQVMFVGRLEPVKGIFAFVEQMIAKSVSWELTIIGDGSQRDALQTLVADHKHIRMTGAVPQKEILSHMRQASLLVLPNQKEEGWGFVVNEAFMNGTPVYCTDLTGARQAVKNAPYSQVVDHNHLDHMVDKVSQFMEQKYSDSQRRRLKNWYNETLSVDSASEFMVACFEKSDGSEWLTEREGSRFGWL